jgi:hypothetical protein
MQLQKVREFKTSAQNQLQKSILPGFLGKLIGARREMTVTLGVGWLPGSKGGSDDYWLTARIRTPLLDPFMEKRIRAILKEIAGDNFDLRYTGPVHALQQTTPSAALAAPQLAIGSSVSHIQTVGGTLGFFARSTVGDKPRGFVSSCHVIANNGRLLNDKRVVSPAQSQREIGELVRSSSFEGDDEKHTDAAFAKLKDSVSVDRSSLPKGKKLSEIIAVARDTTRVMKLGIGSHFTVGDVTSFDQDTFSTRYAGFGKVNFEDQIEVRSTETTDVFATGGDSGALVYNDAGHPLGLLFAAAADGSAYVNPIQDVLDELKVEIDVKP